MIKILRYVMYEVLFQVLLASLTVLTAFAMVCGWIFFTAVYLVVWIRAKGLLRHQDEDCVFMSLLFASNLYGADGTVWRHYTSNPLQELCWRQAIPYKQAVAIYQTLSSSQVK